MLLTNPLGHNGWRCGCAGWARLSVIATFYLSSSPAGPALHRTAPHCTAASPTPAPARRRCGRLCWIVHSTAVNSKVVMYVTGRVNLVLHHSRGGAVCKVQLVVLWELCSVHCAVCKVHYEECIVHCAVCIVQWLSFRAETGRVGVHLNLRSLTLSWGQIQNISFTEIPNIYLLLLY